MQYNLFAAITWDGMASAWSQGTGTEADPYLIETPQHLAYLAEIISGGITSYSGVYFKQMNDFDLAGRKWTPIGIDPKDKHYGDPVKYFSGHYDGNNKFIENFDILPGVYDEGIFGSVKDASISNLTTQGTCTFSTGSSHGAIVGSANNVIISNCTNRCNIVGDKTYETGGIVGEVDGKSVLSGCSNYGSVTGAICGGIVGDVFAGSLRHDTCVIISCHNYGKITLSSRGGGIVGENTWYTSTRTVNGVSIKDTTYAYCKILMCSNTGDLTGTTGAVYGGIAGYGGYFLIDRCYSVANLEAAYIEKPISSIGGILGASITSSSVTISYCYARGRIRSTYSTNRSNLYGIAGGYEVAVNNCYFVGTLYNAWCTKTNNTNGRAIGDGTVVNCFYNEDWGQNTSLVSSGMPKTKEVMRSTSFPQTINGTGEVVFVMDYDNVNEGYPIFGWQATTSSYLINGTCNSMEGTVAGGGTYASGSTATLSAYAAPDYAFLGWSDGSKENPRAVVVSEDATYTALFVRTAYTIRVGQDCQTSIE